MCKLLISILAGCALLKLSNVTEATSLNGAYKNQIRHVQIKWTGKVIRILNDDNQGSRHQNPSLN